MDHPKNHSLFGLGLPGSTVHRNMSCFLIQNAFMTPSHLANWRLDPSLRYRFFASPIFRGDDVQRSVKQIKHALDLLEE